MKIVSGNTGTALKSNQANGIISADDLVKRSELHEIKGVNNRSTDQPNSSELAAVTTASVVSSPSISTPSSSQSNSHFLLTNPWLQTSLLYSQLYSQKVHLQSSNMSSARQQIADAQDSSTFHSPLSSPIPVKNSIASTNSSAIRNTIREKDIEIVKNKRSDVWRPY